MHAKIEPNDQVLVFDRLAIKEFEEVLLRRRRKIRILHTVCKDFCITLT